MKKDSIEYLNFKKPAETKLVAVEILKPKKMLGFTYVPIQCQCICGANVIIGKNSFLNCIEMCFDCKHPKKVYNLKYPRSLTSVYYGMIDRCYNAKHVSYRNYGARGVIVCEEWLLGGIDVFANWALNNGWAKGLQIDKDILGDGLLYSPSNCSFVTRSKNANNRRLSKKYLFRGEMLTPTEISRITGISHSAVTYRISHGKPIEKENL